MKTTFRIVALLLCAGFLAACAHTKSQSEYERRKIYLTEQDYLDDLGQEAVKERREAAPTEQSEYIFNMVPETEKAVYFFDERQQPKIPGQPSDSDYKREKRLWEKPKRYTPDEYYGMQGGDTNASETTSSSYGGYDF